MSRGRLQALTVMSLAVAVAVFFTLRGTATSSPGTASSPLPGTPISSAELSADLNSVEQATQAAGGRATIHEPGGRIIYLDGAMKKQIELGYEESWQTGYQVAYRYLAARGEAACWHLEEASSSPAVTGAGSSVLAETVNVLGSGTTPFSAQPTVSTIPQGGRMLQQTRESLDGVTRLRFIVAYRVTPTIMQAMHGARPHTARVAYEVRYRTSDDRLVQLSASGRPWLTVQWAGPALPSSTPVLKPVCSQQRPAAGA